MFNVTNLIAEIKLPCPIARRALISIEICPTHLHNPVSPPLKDLMQKAYNIAGIKNPVRDEILVEINSLSSKIPSGMTRGIFVF
ncbi:MAG: hypothetical protein LBK58_02825, partial [Prevotellaceae bacterium]|nr:hypothetical protein [Prevotellaceae bacterium]